MRAGSSTKLRVREGLSGTVVDCWDQHEPVYAMHYFENRLKKFMKCRPFTLFSFRALGMKSKDDIDYMFQFFQPYVFCINCSASSTKSIDPNRKLLDAQSDRKDSLSPKELIINKIGDHLQQTNIVVNEEFCNRGADVYFIQEDNLCLIRDEKIPSMRELIHKHDVFGFKFDPRYLPILVYDKDKLCTQTAGEVEEETVEYKICDQPDHQSAISCIHVTKALSEFVIKFREEKRKSEHVPLNELVQKNRKTLSRLLEPRDVELFWNEYTSIFAEKKELWKALLHQMKEYYRILLKRHSLNEDIKKLKRTNLDMRQLLRRYLQPEFKQPEHIDLQMKLRNYLSKKSQEGENVDVDYEFTSSTEQESFTNLQ